jgi:hypothetical protein
MIVAAIGSTVSSKYYFFDLSDRFYIKHKILMTALRPYKLVSVEVTLEAAETVTIMLLVGH